MILVKPISSKIDNFCYFVNESILLVFYIVIITNKLELVKLISEDESLILIRITIATLGFNICVNVFKSLASVFDKIKCWIRQNFPLLPPQYQSTTSIPQQSIKNPNPTLNPSHLNN